MFFGGQLRGQYLVFNFKKFSIYLYVCIVTCHDTQVEVREQLAILSFQHVHPGDQTQVGKSTEPSCQPRKQFLTSFLYTEVC